MHLSNAQRAEMGNEAFADLTEREIMNRRLMFVWRKPNGKRLILRVRDALPLVRGFHEMIWRDSAAVEEFFFPNGIPASPTSLLEAPGGGTAAFNVEIHTDAWIR